MSNITRRRFCLFTALTGFSFAGGTLTGCIDDTTNISNESSASNSSTDDTPTSTSLRDKKALYAADVEDSVVTMYLTVRKGNSDDHTNHTWEEVNTYSKYWYDENGIDQYACEAILQVGDETGPLPDELGYGLTIPNATVKVRGQTSSKNSQKNYKVELKKDHGTWRSQRTINLNKHEGDCTRLRNKLAFDLLKHIPQSMACLTQFVHLYVADETNGSSSGFEDYGLFTQVEQINKTYLQSHGLDENGNLYKIEFFEWYRYADAIKLSTDPSFKKSEFERYLEIKGNEDHSKLIAMLEDVNNYTKPIEDVIAKWFDLENILYWLGIMILLGNYDTDARNYFIYSPLNIERFYILPWDCDVILRKTEFEIRGISEGSEWQRGLSNYWNNILFSRMFKKKQYVQQLSETIEDLAKSYLTSDEVKKQMDMYQQLTYAYLYSEPDLKNAPVKKDVYEKIIAAMPGEVVQNKDSYYETLKKPMPFYIDKPEVRGGSIQFTWGGSYDLNDESITYHATLAKNYSMTDVIKDEDNLVVPLMQTDMLEEGQYFLKVTSRNQSGYTQTAFDYYPTSGGGKAYAVLCFYVLADKTIAVWEETEE